MIRRKWMIVTLVVLLSSWFVLAASPMPTAAQGSESGWRMVGQVGGATQAIAVQGDYAYVGVGLRLVVLDVSDPAELREVGASQPFPHFVEDVVVRGTLAYVAAGGAGLRVVDISNPTHPTEAGAWDSPGYAEGVAIADNIAHIADGPYGLRVVDVTNPAHPTEIGFAYDMNFAFDVVVEGSYAYIAAAGAGLLIADVSDPAHPVELASLDTPGYAYGIDVVRDTAYVADGWEGLYMVNVTDPAHPVQVSSYETPGWAFDVVASDNLAYVANAFKGLQIVDITDPVHPEKVGGEDVWGGLARNVAVAGGAAYVIDYYRGLRTIDVSDPTHLEQMGFYVPMGYADGVTVVGDYAYVAAGGYGLQVVDISDPAHPVQLGIYDTQSYATSVAVAGNYAYIVSYPESFGNMRGLHIVDVSDPTHLIRASYIEGTGAHRDIAVAGNIAYIANEWGLDTIDISDPFNPAVLGFIETWEGFDYPPDVTIGVVVSGTLAYMASTADRLEIVDVSDPTNPSLIVTYGEGPPDCLDIAIVGSKVYLACGREFRVVDVSNPTNPAEMGFCDTPTELYGVVVSENIAYVAGGNWGVAAVDVSDPHSPALVGSFNTQGLARQVDVVGDYVYVADGINGLVILETTSGGATTSSRMWFAESEGIGGSQFPHEAVTRPRSSVNQQFWQRPVSLDMREAPLTSAGVGISEQSTQQATQEYAKIAGACVVTTAADSGAGTLRWCLGNVESGITVTFDVSVFPPTAPVSIALTSPLPSIHQGDITIDASNAGVILDGSSLLDGNGLRLASDGNIVWGLQILHFPGSGVEIDDCENNLIGGDRAQGNGPVGRGNVISGGGGMGVMLSGSGTMSNTIVGNLIGTDVSGMNVLANQGHGVFLCLGASNNRIGGMDPRDRNIISGNLICGVTSMRGAHSNQVIGNYVGTDINGTTALGGGGIGLGGFNQLIQGNLISGNPDAEAGVGDYGGCCNVIIGNLIGTDASGTRAIPNGAGGSGLSIGGAFNRIGGTTPAERNIVSGKDLGIDVSGAGAVGSLVIGNFIGTDITGMHVIGNVRTGVAPGYDSRAMVGGATPAERNVISGNGREGIELQSDYNFILGNYIGTDVSGNAAIGNQGAGIRVVTWLGGAEHNIIQDNLIAHTTSSEQEDDGVGILVDTYAYNTIRRNSIHSNAGKGIVTSNGGNNMLPAAVITAVTETSVSGTACPGCTVEIFSDAEDEGRIYEGSTIADASGAFTFSKGSRLSGPNITATRLRTVMATRRSSRCQWR